MAFGEARLLASLVSSAFLLAPSAAAQVPEDAPADHATASAERAAPDLRASRLIGREIENEQGWRIGKVDDLVVDTQEGRLTYVVITAGSRFEAGETDLALAMPDERLTFDGERLAWSEDLESLRDLPWLRVMLEDEDEEVRKRLASARALIGAPLRDGDQRLGRVKDLVVNVAEGKLRFVVADHDVSWTRAGRMVALDNPRLVGGEDGAPVSVAVEAGALESQPPFDDPRFPRISESGWPQRLERLLSLD